MSWGFRYTNNSVPNYFFFVFLDPEYELCHTKQCVAAAHHILSFIDESVDPCDNFYEFMCGNYIANLTYDAKGIPTSRQFNFENVKHQMLSEHLDRDDEYYELSNFGKKRMVSCVVFKGMK